MAESIIGQKFSRLKVLEFDHKVKYAKSSFKYYYKCLCDCGNICIVERSKLISGHTRSCGCLKDENYKHKACSTKLYAVWKNMKSRCYNPNNKKYKNYGARGITICPEWGKDFLSFKKWAEETGYDENAKRGECTIDRIDVNGDYCPENCRWITNNAQQRNRTNNLLITFGGATHCAAEWVEVLKISRWEVKKYLKAI